MKDVSFLMNDIVLSRSFKTADTYMFQPIEIPEQLKKYFKMYIIAREKVSTKKKYIYMYKYKYKYIYILFIYLFIYKFIYVFMYLNNIY